MSIIMYPYAQKMACSCLNLCRFLKYHFMFIITHRNLDIQYKSKYDVFYNKMRSYIATEPIGCALESLKFQLSHEHPMGSVALLLRIVQLFNSLWAA